MDWIDSPLSCKKPVSTLAFGDRSGHTILYAQTETGYNGALVDHAGKNPMKYVGHATRSVPNESATR